MRLIDGDALVDRIPNPYEQAQVARWVNEAPTVEPRKKGKWRLLPDRDDEHIRYLHCSECHFNGDYESNYCPNCGADMRGEQDAID